MLSCDFVRVKRQFREFTQDELGKHSSVPLLARREALEKELDTATGACRRYTINLSGEEVGSNLGIWW